MFDMAEILLIYDFLISVVKWQSKMNNEKLATYMRYRRRRQESKNTKTEQCVGHHGNNHKEHK
jgi:hypothetical protein